MTLLRQLLHNKKAVIGLAILVIIILVAIFAPLLTEYSPVKRVGRPHQPPSADHLLGTTRLGYDVFTRLLYGARISLAVGFGAGLLIMTAAMLTANFVVDLSYVLLDPRLKRA